MPQVITSSPGIVYSADGVAMPVWVKDPSDIVDYTLDWTTLITDIDGIVDPIIAVTYVVLPGAELIVLSTNFTETTATCWLQGGVLDLTYSVTCRIATDGGRQEDRTFQIVCNNN